MTTLRSLEPPNWQAAWAISSSIINDNPPTVNSSEFDSKNQLESVNDSVSVLSLSQRCSG